MYSKTSTDNLPIVATSISIRPCIDPRDNEDPIFEEAGHYIENCTATNGEKFDDRYTKTGYSVSMFDLQSDSGVLLMSDDLLDMSDKGEVQDFKKDIELQLWTRPMIPWKLSCESTKSKDNVLDMIEVLNEDKPTMADPVRIIGAVSACLMVLFFIEKYMGISSVVGLIYFDFDSAKANSMCGTSATVETITLSARLYSTAHFRHYSSMPHLLYSLLTRRLMKTH